MNASDLNDELFKPYGQVIQARLWSTEYVVCNQGTAKRFNWLANPENLR